MSEHVMLSIGLVVYKKYDDALLAVDSIERFTDSSISKRVYVIDNSVYDFENHYKQAFLCSLSKYNDVEYVDAKSNLGFGKGHNLVLSLLNSDFHAVINPDIVLYSDALSRLVNFLRQHLDVGIVAPILTDEYGCVQRVYRRDITLFDLLCRYIRFPLLKKRIDYHTMMDVDKTIDFECPFVQGSFLVIRTNVFKEINGFDDRYFMYAEDADLCKKVRKLCKVVVHPDARVVHKWEKASHSSIKLMKIHFISLWKYFNKWGWKLW